MALKKLMGDEKYNGYKTGSWGAVLKLNRYAFTISIVISSNGEAIFINTFHKRTPGNINYFNKWFKSNDF